MRRASALLIVAVTLTVVLALARPQQRVERFGFGTPATRGDVRRADTEVRPDGHGLPHDSGTVAAGAVVYKKQCALCHGGTGVEGPFDKLVGRIPGDSFPFARDPRLLGTRTIGNYWPYATTLYDFINRAMPQSAPGSLSSHDVYSVVAYLLYRNAIIPATMTLSERTLPTVVMPARRRFVVDDRLESHVVR